MRKLLLGLVILMISVGYTSAQKAGASGTYTIGEGGDYPNFMEATNDLFHVDMDNWDMTPVYPAGDIVFEILDGHYVSNQWGMPYPMLYLQMFYTRLDGEDGNPYRNPYTITIRSQSKNADAVVIHGHCDISESDNVIVEHITFIQDDYFEEYDISCLSLGEDSNVVVQNCKFLYTRTTPPDDYYAGKESLIQISELVTNVEIRNNIFDGARMSIDINPFVGDGMEWVEDTETGNWILVSNGEVCYMDLTIKDNIFLNSTKAAICLSPSMMFQEAEEGSWEDSEGNSHYYSNPTQYDPIMYDMTLHIENNTFSPNKSPEDTWAAIFTYDTTRTDCIVRNNISGNKIVADDFTDVPTYLYGLFLKGECSIINNDIYLKENNEKCAMNLKNTSAVKIYHNSIAVAGGGTEIFIEDSTVLSEASIRGFNNLFFTTDANKTQWNDFRLLKGIVSETSKGNSIVLLEPENNSNNVYALGKNEKNNKRQKLNTPETMTECCDRLEDVIIDLSGNSRGSKTTAGAYIGAVCDVLPIELLSFTGVCSGKTVSLAWTTATETNNEYFTIEGSNDAIHYTEIARIIGAGTSAKKNNYTYEVENSNTKYVYFRLHQTDINGSSETFKPIAVKCNQKEMVSTCKIYPSPVGKMLNIENTQKILNVSIYNSIGLQVVNQDVNSSKVKLDVSKLSEGFYVIVITNENKEVITRKIIKE